MYLSVEKQLLEFGKDSLLGLLDSKLGGGAGGGGGNELSTNPRILALLHACNEDDALLQKFLSQLNDSSMLGAGLGAGLGGGGGGAGSGGGSGGGVGKGVGAGSGSAGSGGGGSGDGAGGIGPLITPEAATDESNQQAAAAELLSLTAAEEKETEVKWAVMITKPIPDPPAPPPAMVFFLQAFVRPLKAVAPAVPRSSRPIPLCPDPTEDMLAFIKRFYHRGPKYAVTGSLRPVPEPPEPSKDMKTDLRSIGVKLIAKPIIIDASRKPSKKMKGLFWNVIKAKDVTENRSVS